MKHEKVGGVPPRMLKATSRVHFPYEHALPKGAVETQGYEYEFFDGFWPKLGVWGFWGWVYLVGNLGNIGSSSFLAYLGLLGMVGIFLGGS